jgi:hypothetical protein
MTRDEQATSIHRLQVYKYKLLMWQHKLYFPQPSVGLLYYDAFSLTRLHNVDYMVKS